MSPRAWLVTFAITAACGGPSKATQTPSNASPATTSPGQPPILAAILASKRALPAETHRDDECGGAPTLGELVQRELDQRKAPVVTKCNELDDTGSNYQCYAFIGPDDPNPDPSDENWKPTQFSVVWGARRPDGTEIVDDGVFECRYL